MWHSSWHLTPYLTYTLTFCQAFYLRSYLTYTLGIIFGIWFIDLAFFFVFYFLFGTVSHLTFHLTSYLTYVLTFFWRLHSIWHIWLLFCHSICHFIWHWKNCHAEKLEDNWPVIGDGHQSIFTGIWYDLMRFILDGRPFIPYHLTHMFFRSRTGHRKSMALLTNMNIEHRDRFWRMFFLLFGDAFFGPEWITRIRVLLNNASPTSLPHGFCMLLRLHGSHLGLCKSQVPPVIWGAT